MNFTSPLAAFAIFGTLCGILGFFLMRRKFLKELERGKARELELSRRAYEASVLKEISDRIGYSLDAEKVIEIISGSLGDLLPFSTVAHLVLLKPEEKVRLEVQVNESVSREFVEAVKVMMLSEFAKISGRAIVDVDVDERISGKILDGGDLKVKSSFNLPVLISGKVVGLINIASTVENIYHDEEKQVLISIIKQASEAVSRLHEVLENEKGKLIQAVESISDGVLMVNTIYQVILANKKLRSLLALEDHPKIFDIVSVLSGKFDLRTHMEEAFSRNEPLPMEEIEINGKTLQVTASAVLDAKNNKPTGVVVLFHDTTDTRALEKLRQDFMAVMVHELRSPLTTIKSTVEFLQEEDLSKMSPEEFKKYFTTIDLTSQSMLELVNDLLDVAKLEAGKFEVVCEAGSIEKVILERVEAYKLVAQEKGLKLTASLEHNIPDAWIDEIRIKQVLNNLISNAIKYTESGEIKIRAKVESVGGVPADILVSVSDTGIGIEKENVDKLFSKFNQLESGMKKVGNNGTGLGLFIARGIVEASGGKIWAESAGVGLGSAFYFTLGLAQNEGRIAGNIHKDKNSSSGEFLHHPIKSYSTTKVGRA